MTVATHTADANIVVAGLEVYNSIVLGITNAAAARLSHNPILNFVEEPPIVPCMIKLGRDRGSLDGAWGPLLSAPRHGDALPLPSIFG